VRAVSPGQMIRVDGFENPLLVSRVSHMGLLVWVEAFDPESVDEGPFGAEDGIEEPTITMSQVFDALGELVIVG